MLTRRRLIAAGTATAATALAPLGPLARPALAQGAWPNRFVKLIVPFPPGGGTDATARIMSAKLSEIWGQQLVIENRGGAGSNIGAEAAARSEPDGYTMFFGSLPLSINRFIYPSLGYDGMADFAPVSLLCTYPNVLVVPNSSPAKSVGELIAHAKEKGQLYFGSSGIGTSPHLSGELFKRMAKIEATHVPYRGAGPALNDLTTGRIDMMFNTIGALLGQVRGGQIRGLAVSSLERFPTTPDIPSVAESGVPGFDVTSWYALFAPVKTPPEIVRKMNADVLTALADPVVHKRLTDLGVLVKGSTPEELAGLMKADMEKWGPIIQAAGISAK